MKAKALKVTGSFTEWIAPEMNDPYSESAEYRDWYEANGMLDKQPSILYPFGEGEDYISSDVDCLADRLATSNDVAIWSRESELIKSALWTALNEGRRIEVMGITIEPYEAKDLPITPLERFKDYGPYAETIRAAVDALREGAPKPARLGTAWTLLFDLHSLIEEMGDDADIAIEDGKIFVTDGGERRQVFPWIDED